MTLAQIKALFKTGAIPTQADFENLIDKIPNSDKFGVGDATLNFVNPSHPKVLGYRFVTIGDEASYLFIANMTAYKEELYAILDSADLETTQLLNFINKYMRDINVRN